MEIEADVDKLLERRLYLQRYVTSLQRDASVAIQSRDKEFLRLLMLFLMDADELTILALSQGKTSNKAVKELFTAMRRMVKEQKAALLAILRDQMKELIEQELLVTSAALGIGVPSAQGISSLPIGGLSVDDIVSSIFNRYGERLKAEIVQAAASDPGQIATIVRGTKAERYRNGVNGWRNNRLIKPNIDLIVNGLASHAADRVYERAGVDMVFYLATLDYRTCMTCIAAEANGPYVRGKAPRLPMHPRCRCIHVPFNRKSNQLPERPYVKDFRSVKDIPKDERDGIIGTTRIGIEEFFERMSDSQRRKYMGPTKAKLWKQGKISDVRDLVDQVTLKPLRIDQLPT